MKKFLLVFLPLVLIAAVTIAACVRRSPGGGQAQLLGLAQSRGLSPDDAARAIKTFVPPGGRDEYMLFASGGHSGQVHVIGVPSMRLLKTIAVFTPEPWQGYGYGADWSEMALAGEGSDDDHGPHANANANGNGNGNGNGNEHGVSKEPLRWGDAHHPALSETGGKYDGRWLYINDRAHGRIGMVDLSDFRAKQILQVPNLLIERGRAIYKVNCVGCHGDTGKGNGPAAAAMKPPPRDHTEYAYMSTLTNKQLADVIKMGGAIKGRPLMPSHPQIVGADMDALVAYVRTLSAPK